MESDAFGVRVEEELVPGGARVGVRGDNVLHFVHLVAAWHLSTRLGPGAAAFGRGLSKVGGQSEGGAGAGEGGGPPCERDGGGSPARLRGRVRVL